MGFLRWLGLDRNPLRRPSDRIECVVKVVLLAAFVACSPPLAGLAGRMAQAQSGRSWHRVTAVALQSAPSPAAGGPLATYWVPASWRAGPGAMAAAEIPVAAGTRTGSAVRIWTDAHGETAGSSPQGSRPPLPLLIAARAAAFASLALGLVLVAGLIRWPLDRRRMRAWAAEWAATGPRWTARR